MIYFIIYVILHLIYISFKLFVYLISTIITFISSYYICVFLFILFNIS